MRSGTAPAEKPRPLTPSSRRSPIGSTWWRSSGLLCPIDFERAGSGRLRLAGQLQADVTQTCVVTLEPVDAQLDVPVEIEFWPAALVAEMERNAEELGNHGLLDWPEAVVDGRIDLGPVIYETLATALDPYPKRPGTSFDWSQVDPEAASEGKSGPFAALAALKRRERG